MKDLWLIKIEKNDVKDNCFLKAFMYFVNIFSESKGNDHILNISTCLDTLAVYFEKTLIFKKSKNLLHTFKLFLVYSEISYKSKQKLNFHD